MSETTIPAKRIDDLLEADTLTGAERLIVEQGAGDAARTRRVTLDTALARAQATAAGAGAVARSVASKLRDIPSVADYGTGTTAFSAAAAAGFAFIPDGAHVLAAEPTVGTGAFLASPRATFSGAGSFQGYFRGERGFFAGEGSGANIWRFQDRVFIGDAVHFSGVRTPGISLDWIGTSGPLLNYYWTRAQMAVAQTAGGVAVSGASRSSDNDRSERNTIGVAAFGLNDNDDTALGGWAFYGLAALGAGTPATANALCAELNIAALKEMEVPTAYSVAPASGVTAALWLRNGGEYNEAGATLYPASMAIGIVKAPGDNTTFHKGIVFAAAALEGWAADGTGYGVAVEMARYHRMQWAYDGSGTHGGFIGSEAGAKSLGLMFRAATTWDTGDPEGQIAIRSWDNSQTAFLFRAQPGDAPFGIEFIAGAAGTGLSVLRATGASQANLSLRAGVNGAGVVNFFTGGSVKSGTIRHVASADREWFIQAAANPAAVQIGTTAGDLWINPAGVVRFGTYASGTGKAYAGTIEIKDAAGTTRHVMIAA